MRDDGVKLGIVPLTPPSREQNRGSTRAHGDRHGDEFGFGSSGNEAKSAPVRAGGKPANYAGIVDRLRRLHQLAAHYEPDHKADQEKPSDAKIECQCERAPLNREPERREGRIRCGSSGDWWSHA